MAYKHTAAPNLYGEPIFKNAFRPGADLWPYPAASFVMSRILGALDAPDFLCAGACERMEYTDGLLGGFAAQQLSWRG